MARARRSAVADPTEHVSNNVFVRELLKRQTELIHRQNENLATQIDLTRDLRDTMHLMREELREHNGLIREQTVVFSDFRDEVKALREVLQLKPTNPNGVSTRP